MVPSHLLYLHGFRSSPRSVKARGVAAWLQAHRPDLVFSCPQLPPSPREAIDLALSQLADWPLARTAIVGSSLGGFYATVLAERLGCPAVLFNPAVNPARDLARHIGEQTAWHHPEDRFYFREAFIGELETLSPPTLTRLARYFPVIATGDEVLDWREMTARYQGAPWLLIEGSDHALSDFELPLAYMVQSLGLDGPVL